MLQRVFIGLLLVGAGVLFLLNQTGLITINIGELLRTYWPVFIIIAGVNGMLASLRYGWSAAIWNVVVCGVGVIFLLHNLGITGLSIGEMFAYLGPVALILFGLSVMFKPSSSAPPSPPVVDKEGGDFRHPDRSYYDIYGEEPPSIDGKTDTPKEGCSENNKENPKESREEIPKETQREIHKQIHKDSFKADMENWKNQLKAAKWEHKKARHAWKEDCRNWRHYQRQYENEHKHEYINTFGPGHGAAQHKSGFIGDVVLGKDYWELQPMTISHFIGDTLIDLTKATVPYGETKIVVSAFIGDVKMLVPADLDLEISVSASSFIGDMHVLDRHETGMMRNLRTESASYDEAERKIKLIVSSFIGDVVVRKVG
ncbi:cell wall-active antibiotics response protein LiaF [Paenibacillus chartarius]|uniref:Cell wall-active antibiotics response protein LiaF n=1 Tax=Paenibacillus chartarius TaxID=747481 RepID=A0ABV6DK40_9BACL